MVRADAAAPAQDRRACIAPSPGERGIARRIEIGRAVAAKTIAPETGNDLGTSLQGRATEIRNAAAA